MSAIQDAVKTWLARGVSVVPLNGKKAIDDSWPTKEYTADHFREGDNVGIKCGSAIRRADDRDSELRVYDLDADSDQFARALCALAPETVRFGHSPTKLISHLLVASDAKLTTTQYADTDGSMLGELRGLKEDGSIGFQTMVPPSIWRSADGSQSEPLTYCGRDWPPAILTGEEVTALAGGAALVALLARHWPAQGHDLRLALSDYLPRSPLLSVDCATRLIELAAELGGASRAGVRDVQAAMRSTQTRRKQGQPTAGRSRLRDVLGDDVVRLLDSWLELDEPNLIDRFNESHFIIRVGTKTRNTMIGNDATFPPSFESISSFRTYYANHPPVGKKSAANVWLKSPQRRTYPGELVFAPPPRPYRQGIDYNLWRGYAVEPDPQPYPERRCALYLKHVREVICGGEDPTVAEYLLDVLAFKVQQPGRLTGVAVVIRGLTETGKNTFTDTYADLFAHADQRSIADKAELVVGRFNSALSGRVVLVLDEALWPGHKAFEGVLKSLVTNATLMIERKGVDATPEPNLIQLFVLTNSPWAWPFDADDRRALILEADRKHKGDREYFAALYAEITNGGREALLTYLQQRSITHDLRSVPRTRASAAQLDLTAQSKESVQAWWLEALERGHVAPDGDSWPEWISTKDAHDQFQAEYPQRTNRSLQSFTRQWQQVLPGGLRTEKRQTKDWVDRQLGPQVGTKRRPGFAMPPLRTCREAFERATRTPRQWPPTEENETQQSLPTGEVGHATEF